ncbi:MAG: protein kinase [Polyangiaceae bacterium]
MSLDQETPNAEGRRRLSAVLKELGRLSPEVAVALGLGLVDEVVALRARGWSPVRLHAGRISLVEDNGLLRLELDDVGREAVRDEPSDVAMIAGVLYHLLAGRPPRGSQQADSASASGEVVPLRGLAPWLELGVARLIHDALSAPETSACPTLDLLAERLRRHGDLRLPLAPSDLEATSYRHRQVGSTETSVHASWATHVDTSHSEVELLAEQTIGGRYRLLRRIGAGGMGVVYEATAPDGARVAVKLIESRARPAASAAVHRLLREARAAGAIGHPHVVHVYDSGVDATTGRAWLAMELVAGGSMATLACPLPPGPVLRLFIQVLEGLAAAHARGIIHRDVKPSNVLLAARDGGVLVAQVSDFGLAKQTTASGTDDTTLDLTRSGGVLGSPRYMSPEQAKNAKRVDQRSDVWSVAVSVFESLTGTRPWQECTTVGEIIVAICTEDLPDMRKLAPWLDPALIAVVRRGAARDPAARWPTAASFAEALAPFAAPRDEVTRETLRPITAQMPAGDEGARPSAPTGGGVAASSASTGTVVTTIEPPPRRALGALRRLRWPGVAAGAAVVVGVSLVRMGSAPSPTIASSPTPALQAPASASHSVTAPPPPPLPVALEAPAEAVAPSASAMSPPPSARTARAASAPRPPPIVTEAASAAASATSKPAAASSAAPPTPKPIDNW